MKHFHFLIEVSFSTELMYMQPSTAVIINNCNAHWRPKTSVAFLHWHLALRWRMCSRVVNPGNPAISHHVVRRKPPIALENKNSKRKETKAQGKENFFLVRVEKYPASLDKLILVLETFKFCYWRMQKYRYFFMLSVASCAWDLQVHQVRVTVVNLG